jgi:hypothetical protein
MPRAKPRKRPAPAHKATPAQLRAIDEFVRTSGVVITDEMVAAIGAEIDAAVRRAHARLRRARRAGKA